MQQCLPGEGPECAPTERGNIVDVCSNSSECKWASLIKQVSEADHFVCPRCNGPMWIIAFIEQPKVIEKVLPDLPACAEGRQGALAGPSPQRSEGYPLPLPLLRVVAV